MPVVIAKTRHNCDETLSTLRNVKQNHFQWNPEKRKKKSCLQTLQMRQCTESSLVSYHFDYDQIKPPWWVYCAASVLSDQDILLLDNATKNTMKGPWQISTLGTTTTYTTHMWSLAFLCYRFAPSEHCRNPAENTPLGTGKCLEHCPLTRKEHITVEGKLRKVINQKIMQGLCEMNICASYLRNKNEGKKKHLAHVASLFILSLLYLH